MNEEILKALAQSLFEIGELHYESDDCVVDVKRDGNILTTKIELLKDRDKVEFEEWLQNVDDDLFTEVLEELECPYTLDEIYNSDNYKEVIDKVISKTKEIATRKIEQLQKLF